MLITIRTFVPGGIVLHNGFHTSAILCQLPGHKLYQKVDFMKCAAGFYAIVDPMDNESILYLSERDYKLTVRVAMSQDTVLLVLARPGDTRTASTSAVLTPSSDSKNSPPRPAGIPSDWVLLPFKEGHRWGPAKVEMELRRVAPKRGQKTVDALLGRPIRATSTLSDLPTVTFDRRETNRRNFQNLWWHVSRLQKFLSYDENGDPMVALTAETLLTLILNWGIDLNIKVGGPLSIKPGMRDALFSLGRNLALILQNRGKSSLVAKMKNTLFFVNRWLGGVREVNPFLLGEPVGMARSGLPRIIPLYFRRKIAARDIKAIRLITSILKAYTVFEAPHPQTALQSVTGSHPNIPAENLEDFRKFCKDVFWPQVVRKYAREAGLEGVMRPYLRVDPESRPYIPVRGGPNHSVGLLGAPHDALAWHAARQNHVLEWARHMGDTKTEQLFAQSLAQGQLMQELSPMGSKLHNWSPGISYDTGKLGLLPEPAGKVRIIAIADYWTQRLMKPVHDWMMKVLSVLPTDATFDQEGSLRSYVEACASAGVVTHHSIDLKSATDMIPLELYEAVLGGIWEKRTVELWMALLTDRFFRVPDNELVAPRLRQTHVQYGRGQPMGTLSSWASMALVHHALELYSAQCAGKDPRTFTMYRVLGDDNVTGDCAVAKSYRENCARLSVPFSEAKTLSGQLFIFASQIYLGDQNVSPMSLKEDMGVKSFSQRLEMALRAVKRGWLSDKPTTARFLRLLLRGQDYIRSTKEFALGRLGKVAQAALVSAFGVTGRAIAQLAPQKSSYMPFLLAMQGKVQALEGDQSHLSSSVRSNLAEIELLLCISIMRSTIGLIKRELELLRQARIRWGEWRDAIVRRGILPLSYRQGPVSWILNVPEKSYDELPLEDQMVDPGLWGSYSEAVWPLILDSYGPYIGVSTSDPLVSDYDAVVDEDEGYGEEDCGMGVTFSSSSTAVVTTGGLKVEIPKVILETETLLSEAESALTSLIRFDGTTPPAGVQSPWDLVEKVIRAKAEMPRLPEFYTLDSLIPDRTPKAVDLLRSWVRQMKSFHEVSRYLPIESDFSVSVEAPLGVFSEHEEALNSTERSLLQSLKGKRGSSSDPVSRKASHEVGLPMVRNVG